MVEFKWWRVGGLSPYLASHGLGIRQCIASHCSFSSSLRLPHPPERTMSGAQQWVRTGQAAPRTLEQLEGAVRWWNNNTPPLLHYSVNKVGGGG